MKLFPAAFSTQRAEQRLEQSKQRLHQQLDHIQSTLNSTLTQPSSLLIVTGVSALLGAWLARRKTKVVASGSISAGFPVRSLVFTLLLHFILERITKRSRADEV
jgi:hypothetical protein